ncbi:ROK family protein [Flavimarina sp. Hel_I_48]|uniref:ROK family protein n=1 Tax=Flavimarina sp. Hel_I_48 TaxID=1392488 RepID=UPI0004DF87D1|nr:ROK family protein [Flavimarina sp. Hel_I_48]
MKEMNDDRIVMTLDAGGTNFVFSALQGGKEIIQPIVLDSNSDNLDSCLQTIITGFRSVKKELLPKIPVAISFAFPGPADYKNGIIGDLPNFPSFRGGIALGPMLKEIFNIPTLINNDGDLFAYGEAVAGFLPRINGLLAEHKIEREYKNLIGITLGTGFGAGVVINHQICLGDNSAAGEIWLTRNYIDPSSIAEESVSIRGIKRVYSRISGDDTDKSPLDIYEIAKGRQGGDKEAALQAFKELAQVMAESLANAITLLDAPVVIGGGVSGAAEFIIPELIAHFQSTINDQGKRLPRLIADVFNVEDPATLKKFLNSDTKYIEVPFSKKTVSYTQKKYVPIGISHLGASNAISLGAYTLALDYLDKKNLYASALQEHV